MKRKTCITLSDDLFQELDRRAASAERRSAYIEQVLRQHFRRQARAAQEADDRERINATVAELNAEMSEVLDLQTAGLDDAYEA